MHTHSGWKLLYHFTITTWTIITDIEVQHYPKPAWFQSCAKRYNVRCNELWHPCQLHDLHLNYTNWVQYQLFWPPKKLKQSILHIFMYHIHRVIKIFLNRIKTGFRIVYVCYNGISSTFPFGVSILEYQINKSGKAFPNDDDCLLPKMLLIITSSWVNAICFWFFM